MHFLSVSGIQFSLLMEKLEKYLGEKKKKKNRHEIGREKKKKERCMSALFSLQEYIIPAQSCPDLPQVAG